MCSGSMHVLKPKTNKVWYRRVLVHDTISLSARSDTDVTGQLVYRDLKDP